jgi:predicted transcriptional regulator
MRFNPDLVERMEQAADERAVSFNWLVEKACNDFMNRLIPIDEVKWVRDDDSTADLA